MLGFRQLAHQALEGDRYMRSAYLMVTQQIGRIIIELPLPGKCRSILNSTINMFIPSKPEKKIDDGNTIRIVLPFKDQIAANAVRRQLRDLNRKICVTL